MLEIVDDAPIESCGINSLKIRNLKEDDYEVIKNCLLKTKSQLEVDMLALEVYLKLSSMFCFTAEVNGEPFAFIFASLNPNEFYEYYESHYLPSMQGKYSSEISLQAEVFLRKLTFFFGIFLFL